MDMTQYLGVFLDEAAEQIALLETNFVALENDDNRSERLQALFRAAHTLKGSSRAMGFLTIGSLTHEMENVLDPLRKGEIELSAAIVDALLACLDALGGLLNRVKETGADLAMDDSELAALIGRLEELRSAPGDAAPATPRDAAPAEERPVEQNHPAAGAGCGDPFRLKEHQKAAVADARATGNAVLHITIVLRDDCLMKSIRVLMAFSALKPLGELLVSEPPEEDLEEERFEQRFDLLLATDKTAGEVEKALATLSEVEQLSVLSYGAADDPVDTPAATPAMKAREAAPAGAATPEPAAKGSPKPPAAISQTIRVDVARLDNLLNLVGELVIERTQMARVGGKLRESYPSDEYVASLSDTVHRIARVTGELQDEIMKARMLPIEGVFQRFPRMVRDLAQKTGKEVDFDMEGGDTELDRSVLESIGDPIIHLLRNSLDHGIESPADREASGKPRRGRVLLKAAHQENYIVIEVCDDGNGIDPARIKAASVQKGLITEAQAERMSDKDALGLIFTSGLSTAQQVSDISGRGVGMDIVKSNIEKLGGQILVESTLGKGSRFTIRLPLTLAILRALLVEAGGGCYVLPLSSVLEMLRLGETEDLVPRRSIRGQATIVLRGKTVPLASLTHLLLGDPEASSVSVIPENAYIVIVGLGENQVGIAVDRLLGQQEAVIKSLGSFLGDIPGVSGATILGDGHVALIVDVPRAVEMVRETVDLSARRGSDPKAGRKAASAVMEPAHA